jgi:hypothetical protein
LNKNQRLALVFLITAVWGSALIASDAFTAVQAIIWATFWLSGIVYDAPGSPNLDWLIRTIAFLLLVGISSVIFIEAVKWARRAPGL